MSHSGTVTVPRQTQITSTTGSLTITSTVAPLGQLELESLPTSDPALLALYMKEVFHLM
jgi:hypothetical protein